MMTRFLTTPPRAPMAIILHGYGYYQFIFAYTAAQGRFRAQLLPLFTILRQAAQFFYRPAYPSRRQMP